MEETNDKLESIRQYARTQVLEKTKTDVKNDVQTAESELEKKKLNLFSADVLKQTNIAQNSAKVNVMQKEIIDTPLQQTEKLVEKEIEQQTKERTTPQFEVEEQKDLDEQKIESLYDSSLTVESSTNENVENEINTYTNKKSKNYKFRFRLATGIFCCLVAVMGGWMIGNAVEIGATSSKIASETIVNEEYNVNIAKYLLKISKLDGINQDEPNPSDEGALVPIEEIIPITPTPLKDKTEYEKQSNWFDKICNWFKNLFGG